MSRKSLDHLDFIGDFLRRSVNFGKETLAGAGEEAEKIVKRLVARGQITEDEARRMVNEFLEQLQENRRDVQSLIDERVRATLKVINIPVHQDLEELETRIDELNLRLDRLIEVMSRKRSESSSQADS